MTELKVVKAESPGTLTFENFDKFQRQGFSEKLTQVITKLTPFYEEAFVLSLNGRFGTGKTTFLKMWKNSLIKKSYKTIYVNAWETDFDDEPLIPIATNLLNFIARETDGKKLSETLKETIGTLALVTNDIISHTTGVDISEKIKADHDKSNTNLNLLGGEIYKIHSQKVKTYKTLKIELENYVNSLSQKPLVIFIDELDRVRPDYAVKFLEAIKHVFSAKNICFVLAVDREQLKSSIQQLYGNIDFENYYRRFITREASLAETKRVDITAFITNLTENFFDNNDISLKLPFEKQNMPRVIETMVSISKSLKFVPRQIESMFKVFSQFILLHDNELMANPSWIAATIILIAVSIDCPKVYKDLGEGSISPKEFYEYLIEAGFPKDNVSNDYRYVLLTSMAFLVRGNKLKEHQEIVKILEPFQITPSSSTEEEKRKEVIDRLLRSKSQWNDISEYTGFQTLYGSIESWNFFLKS